MVAGALAPMVVLAIVAALLLQQHERQAMERDAIRRARAAMSAVDAHLRNSIVSLETLGASKNLESGNIAAFHAESQRVLRTQPGWVNIGLTSSARIQLSNAVYAFGKPEPLTAIPDGESFATAVRTARAEIGSVSPGTAVRSPTVRVRVPISYAGEVRYVLSAPLHLKQLADLLEAQRSPEDKGVVLVDRDKRVIARIPAAPAGSQAPDDLREAIERTPEGLFDGSSPEGRPTCTSYTTSLLSGWALGIAIPAEPMEARARRSVAILAAGVLAALAAGCLLAWLVARRIPH
jgi:hypothetical protein